MPINARPEFFKAQKKYLDAKTREEKIVALEEMIRTAPTHKGGDNLLADLKSKLSKMKKVPVSKKARRITTIPKEGDAQVCILGNTQSGKSTLLSKLTNARPSISSHPFTTSKPEIGCLEWEGVKVQIIEIPSTFKPIHMNIAQNCDGIILIYRNDEEKEQMLNIMKMFRIRKPVIEVREYSKGIEEKIWGMLGLIRIYTKESGKKPQERALVLERGATVEDAAGHLHKDFLKLFKFARVWGKSVKHTGERVGLEYVLKDKDVLEIRIS